MQMDHILLIQNEKWPSNFWTKINKFGQCVQCRLLMSCMMVGKCARSSSLVKISMVPASFIGARQTALPQGCAVNCPARRYSLTIPSCLSTCQGDRPWQETERRLVYFLKATQSHVYTINVSQFKIYTFFIFQYNLM